MTSFITLPQACTSLRTSYNYLSQFKPVINFFRNASDIESNTEIKLKYETSFAKKNIRTAAQVYATKNGDITLLSPAPAIKNLVLSGGGASGWIMPHALAQMDNTFDHIAGTSAGALVGSMLASGLTAVEVDLNLEMISLPSLLEVVPHFGELYPEITLIPERLYPSLSSFLAYIGRMFILKTFAKGWQRTAQSMVQTMDKWSSESISKHLNNQEIWQKIKDAHSKGQISTRELNRLIVLKNAKWFDSPTELYTARTKYMITFKDLAVLHSIEPNIFKKLTLISSKIDQNYGELGPSQLEVSKKIFSVDNTPNMPIAIAGRASMSIPFYFQDTFYCHEFYKDGGLVSRIPAEIFLPEKHDENNLENSHQYAETAVFIFGNDKYKKEIDQVLYKKPVPGPSKSIENRIAQWFSNYPKHSEMAAEDNRKLYNAGLGVYIIDNGSIDTFDMFAPKEEYDKSKKLAKAYMQKQLEMRKNQAYALSFRSVVDAWESLNKQQKIKVREAGHPELEPGFYDLPEFTQNAQRAFYVLAQASRHNLSRNDAADMARVA